MTADTATNRSGTSSKILVYALIFLGVYAPLSAFDYLLHYDYYGFFLIFPFIAFVLVLLILVAFFLIRKKFMSAIVVLIAFFCSWLLDFEIKIIDHLKVRSLIENGTLNSDVIKWGEPAFYQYNYETLLVKSSTNDLEDIKEILQREGFEHLSQKCNLDLSRVHSEFVVVRGWCQ